jgi:hypothetical protein
VSWVRRNQWGLLALVPALVLALWSSAVDGYRLYWQSAPRTPVSGAPGGWVDYGGARLRLAELVPATDLVDFDGHPVTLPAGTKPWRARIAVDPALAGCRLLLEDATGRTFGAGPAELERAQVPFASCAPDKASGGAFETVAYFVLPAGARPVAVRVAVANALPRYARLIAG